MNYKHLLAESLSSELVFSDASNVAAGAYTVVVEENIVHHTWSKSESLMSSTWRELKAND